jgi:hypothetical protein
MEEQIAENIKDPKIRYKMETVRFFYIDLLSRSWIVPNFSTTTPSDRVVGSVVLMATLQKYLLCIVFF